MKTYKILMLLLSFSIFNYSLSIEQEIQPKLGQELIKAAKKIILI